MQVDHIEAKSRFEAVVEGQISVLEYRRSPGKLVLFHTEVPAALRGRGVASKLATAALDFANSQHLKVVPQCPFVAEFLKEHPEYAGLAADA